MRYIILKALKGLGHDHSFHVYSRILMMVSLCVFMSKPLFTLCALEIEDCKINKSWFPSYSLTSMRIEKRMRQSPRCQTFEGKLLFTIILRLSMSNPLNSASVTWNIHPQIFIEQPLGCRKTISLISHDNSMRDDLISSFCCRESQDPGGPVSWLFT